MHHEQPDSDDTRAALMRRAGDLIGAERLARQLDIAPRSLYYLMKGEKPVKDGILADTRKRLIDRRHEIADLVQAIREAEAAAAMAEAAARKAVRA